MRLLVHHDGQQLGPFTADEARAALASGRVHPADLAWAEGMEAWIPLATLLGGGPPSLPGQDHPPSTGMAKASLVLGILSFFLCALTGIPAIVCGHIARSRATSAPRHVGGGGMATAGLILGYFSVVMIPFVAILAAIAVPAISAAMDRAREVQSISECHQIALACHQYASEHGDRYPATLEELVPDYLPTAKPLTSPLLIPAQPVAYFYYQASRQPAPGSILLLSKWHNRRGYLVTNVDGSAAMTKTPPPLP